MCANVTRRVYTVERPKLTTNIMETIAIIDAFSTNTFHEMFNVSILIEAAKLYNKVEYFGTYTSIENQKKILYRYHYDISNVVYHYVSEIHGSNILKLVTRYVVSAIKTLHLVKTCKGQRIVILNNNPFFCLLWSRIKSKVVIYCHGEMELLRFDKLGKLAYIQSKLLKKTFITNSIPQNIRLVVLGEAILTNLRCILPKTNYTHFKSQEHPYLFTVKPCFDVPVINKQIIKIGIVGITTKAKGWHILKGLLELKLNNVRFYHIGKISDPKQILTNLGLYIVPRNKDNELSRIDYEKWVSKMDYLLYLYSDDNYRLTASGALFEALSNIKPIITLRNSYFQYILKIIGEIGYMCKDEKELSTFLKNFVYDPEKYTLYINNIISGRDYFNPEQQIKLFKELTY